jgi:tetratricopeptide (TPR) repeat protein
MQAVQVALPCAPGRQKSLRTASQPLVVEPLIDHFFEEMASADQAERELIDRLVSSESDPTMRARYAYTAALLWRDDLRRPDAAVRLLWFAIDSDPHLLDARAELEKLLAARGAWAALAGLYGKLLTRSDGDAARIEGTTDADRREQLRLWVALSDLCWERLGQRDDAITALAVACRLAPDDDEMLRHLAGRCEQAGPEHADRATACHHELLRRNRRRLASYRALVRLYARAGMERHARAVNEALAFAAMSADSSSRPRPRHTDLDLTGRALAPETWTTLLHPDEDHLVGAIAALLAPTIAAASAQRRKRTISQLQAEPLPDGAVAARVLARVAASLGVEPPETLACTEARFSLEVRVLTENGAARPVLLLGGPLLQGIGERALAFHLGRALASMRGGGLLRWVMPQPEKLGLLIDAAVAMATGAAVPAASALAATVRSLERALPSMQREQLTALGEHLVRRSVPGSAAARAWMHAHDLSLDRVGLVACGDLSTALHIIAEDAPSAGHAPLALRELEMVWSAASPEVLDARAAIEQWPESVAPIGPSAAAGPPLPRAGAS